MPNPNQPAIDRMHHLASSATQESSMFAALSQEGYGGEDVPPGVDNPESLGKAKGKAIALIACHFAVKYNEYPQEAAIEKMLLPLQAVMFAFGGLGSLTGRSQMKIFGDSGDPNVVKGMIQTFIKKSGTWDKLKNSGGFGDGSIFGKKIEKLKSGVIGGDSDEKRYVFAVAVLAAFVARWTAGETKALNNLYTYSRVFNYLNIYYRQYGDDASPGMGALSIDEPTLRWLQHDDHTNLFLEIQNESDKTSPHGYTMFGFEDLTEIFQEPIDPQLMKDAELQSYTLRGELHYDEWWWHNTPYCEDKHIPVTNSDGKVTGYNNIGPVSFPCIDQANNIVPITGTLFERTFVESPPVAGTYDGANTAFITAKTREDYPADAWFGDSSHIETYISEGDNRFITSVKGGGSWGSYLSDVSQYEPYYFIDSHEAGAGNSFPGWGCEPPIDGGQCTNYFYGNSSYLPLEHLCTGAGWEWLPWQDQCLHPAPPSPSPFPGGFVRDMSLRHPLISQDHDTSLNYWEDLNSWEWTGFVMAPLMFTPERIEGSYKDFLSNPKFSVGNLGRRAFSFGPRSTAGVLSGTCGPPQPGVAATTGDPNDWVWNNQGGPFVYGHVYAENRTKKQKASINIFPGWAYRYSKTPYGTYDLHRTGGWNMPLITMTAYSLGWSDPETAFYNQAPQVDFHGTKISNNYNADGKRSFLYVGERDCWLMGTGINPETNERYRGCWGLPKDNPNLLETIYPYDPMDPPDPFHYNQELIVPHKFFGMGDGCQDVPVKTSYSLNAGSPYSIHKIDVTGITHPYLKTVTGKFADINAETYFSKFIMGQYGDSYWDEFVTGWINTGAAFAGEAVHCLHLRTGISTVAGSTKKAQYYYLGTGIGDVHPNFPYKGIDCLTNFGPLAPYPNYSKCCEDGMFPNDAPFNGPNPPTTTTTEDPNPTTTTTCDPYDPNCQQGPTTTTTLEDPLYQMGCEDGIKVSCPDGKDPGDFYTYDGLCSWEQCVSISCEDPCDYYNDKTAWDSGVWPREHDWVEQTFKQANENPPRYWHGPYASTYFRFMYPNAEAALSGQYPKNQGLEITGFPAQVKFATEIKEWIVKDWVSGGYINEYGEITWDEIVKLPAPEFKNENADYNWSGFVDDKYIGDKDAYIGQTDGSIEYGGDATVLKWPEALGRNIETYSKEVFFDRGNKSSDQPFDQYGIYSPPPPEGGNPSLITAYRYGTTLKNAIFEEYHIAYGGFHRYTGYSFPVTVTYAKPSYALHNHSQDYSSLYNALGKEAGNDLYYSCGSWDMVDRSLDPIYFMKMVSNSDYSGEHNKGLGGGCHPTITGGAHPEGIYGDHWMGQRPKSLFTEFRTSTGYLGEIFMPYGNQAIAGDIDDWVDCTGMASGCFGLSEEFQALMEDFPCYDPDDSTYHDMYYCEYLTQGCALETPESSPEYNWRTTRSCDKRVWLFNLSANAMDVHVRAPDYISGYILDSNPGYYGIDSYDAESSSCDILKMHGPDTATLKFTITGTDTMVRFYDDEDIGTKEAAFANPNNKQLDIFKRDWVDEREVNFEQIVYEKEGLLFEKSLLTGGNWEIKDGSYESVLEYGKRLAENQEFVRVSGWRETSKVKIKLTDIKLGSYGAIPYDQYWAMESDGNCMVTGRLRYNYQREASIYSEGIVLEDVSDDSLKDVLDYPHYASETMKRPGITLPTGANASQGEYYIPDEHPVTKQVLSAPSKMVVRRQEFMTIGSGHDNYVDILRGGGYYYNRYVWPTMSDMATWNGGSLSWEGLPALDKYVYPVSNLMICAAAGQPYADDLNGEFIQRHYTVTQHKCFYDGVVLDPTINREWMLDLPTSWSYYPNNSYLVPAGTSINDIKIGLVPAVKHTLEPPGAGDGKVVGILT
jgi:hypothetical protein